MSGKIKIALIGAGGRGHAYAGYERNHGEAVEFVAVAEPREEVRKSFAMEHNIKQENQFESWQDLLKAEKLADAVIVATQDLMHYEPTMVALKKGYHVLLEKPMTPSLKECKDIVEESERTGKIVMVCHVLRYTNFFKTIKKLLDDNRIGKLKTIQHSENVAFWHFAHSFVRGNWRNKETSGPLILTKSCHDMDLLYWLAGAECTQLSSFASTREFVIDNAPKGAPDRCLDGCPHRDTCKYYAPRIYVGGGTWLSATGNGDEGAEKRVINDLKTNWYGRCVYKCDNDVVDTMSSNFIFENGVTATFNLCAFTNECYREIRLLGTEGEIRGNMEVDKIELIDFNTQNIETIALSSSSSGHGGGDEGIMRDFLNAINGVCEAETSAKISYHSHQMAWAVEESRLTGRVINLKDF